MDFQETSVHCVHLADLDKIVWKSATAKTEAYAVLMENAIVKKVIWETNVRSRVQQVDMEKIANSTAIVMEPDVITRLDSAIVQFIQVMAVKRDAHRDPMVQTVQRRVTVRKTNIVIISKAVFHMSQKSPWTWIMSSSPLLYHSSFC